MVYNDEIMEAFRMISGLNGETYKTIAQNKEKLITWKEDLLNAFISEVKAHSGDMDSDDKKEAKNLETTLVDWYEDIISGDTGEDFWNRQWKVGLKYLADDVDLNLLIAMMSFLQKKFAEKAFQEYPQEQALEIFLAFKTITDAILATIVDGYLNLYINAIEQMSGIKRPVIERMASLECKKILEEDG
ncbi:MAG: hypothetical protein GXO05_03245 [Aquificae bacterium]|nr:hypothetical protein [Aquificota bacterium]